MLVFETFYNQCYNETHEIVIIKLKLEDLI